MHVLTRAAFVIIAIVVGTEILRVGVFGYRPAWSTNSRLGEWRQAKVRPACYGALEFPERDALAPRLPAGDHRIDTRDFHRAQEMTVALNCYLVTNPNAVCEPSNRTYIVDYIAKYYAKKDDMLTIAARYGQAEIRNVEQMWDSTRNRAIDTALKDNIRTGRLIKSDFGWSMPAALKPLFQQAAAADSCPAHARTAASGNAKS